MEIDDNSVEKRPRGRPRKTEPSSKRIYTDKEKEMIRKNAYKYYLERREKINIISDRNYHKRKHVLIELVSGGYLCNCGKIFPKIE
jgi:hypothetical protein